MARIDKYSVGNAVRFERDSHLMNMLQDRMGKEHFIFDIFADEAEIGVNVNNALAPYFRDMLGTSLENYAFISTRDKVAHGYKRPYLGKKSNDH